MKIFAALIFLLLAQAAHAGTITIPSPAGDRDPALVQFPDSIRAGETLPVILLLHGFKNSAEYVNNFFGIGQQVNARRFALITPNGRKNMIGARFWNATDSCCDFGHDRGDDVKYLQDLLKDVATRLPVNPRKIYAAGHSNGGFMAHRLACETHGLFAGIASFAGATFNDAALCPNLDRLSMLQIHAVDDPTIRFEGGPGYLDMAPYPGAETTVKRYLARNVCPSQPATRGTLDIAQSIPGTDSVAETWSACAGDTQVALWKILAHRSAGHRPHIPKLNEEFREQLLNFLFASTRE